MLERQSGKGSGLLALDDQSLASRLEELTPEQTDALDFAAVIDELMACAAEEYAQLADFRDQCIDCCGTGGSGIPRFNTSTAVAFIFAAAGLKVCKFGNRAASSRSGSFDFLSAIGFKQTLKADAAVRVLEKEGLAFVYAPDAYPQLARLAAIRKALGHPTVLNYAGPLLNPCRPRFRIMGVSHMRMQKLVADLLSMRQPDSKALIVRSSCGLDEICTSCGAEAYSVREKQTPQAVRLAGDIGTACACTDQIEEFSPAGNAKRFFAIIDGADRESSSYQMMLINSAHALQLCSKSEQSLDDGLNQVAKLLSNGAVKQTYLRLREAHESYSG